MPVAAPLLAFCTIGCCDCALRLPLVVTGVDSDTAVGGAVVPPVTVVCCCMSGKVGLGLGVGKREAGDGDGEGEWGCF